MVATCPWDPTQKNPLLLAFRERYRKRFNGEQPETYASHSYDGMNMLIEAIEEAGLNRAKIRDALEKWKKVPYEGVTGPIPLNDILVDAGPIAIATVQSGKWVFMSEEEAGISLPRIVKKR